jgi:hypothetical protein
MMNIFGKHLIARAGVRQISQSKAMLSLLQLRFVALPRATFSVEAAGIATETEPVPIDLGTASKTELHNLPVIKAMRQRYPGLKVNRLPKQVFALDFERDVVPAEEKLVAEYGFLKEEVSFIMRYNPKFILLQEGSGIKALKAFLVDKKGFSMEALRTLIVRYPYILSKTTEDLSTFFETLKSQGLTEEESMKALLECPKLISKRDLGKQIKELQFLFRLYHGITEQEVTEVFRSFPYLYLCDQTKVQKFLGAFRHYKMTKDQILNMVSSIQL